MRWNATTCLARLARAGGVVILVEQTLENSALNFRRHLLAAGISRKHDHDFMKHTLHSKVSTSVGCQTLQRMRHTTMLSFQFFPAASGWSGSQFSYSLSLPGPSHCKHRHQLEQMATAGLADQNS